MEYLDETTSLLLQLFFILIVVIYIAEIFLDFISNFFKTIFRIGKKDE
jgi:hypothetical protein